MTDEQWKFNEWVTELADPFWLKDAQKDGEFFDANGFARALLSASKPAATEGWKLVPLEPTNAMTYVGQKHRYEPIWSIGAIYREMLAAAPAAPSAEAAAPAQSEPVAWERLAAAWLRGRAAAQAQNNERWPEHAKAYARWRYYVTIAQALADDLEGNGLRPRDTLDPQPAQTPQVASQEDERAAFEAQFERTIGHKPERYATFNYERENARSLWKWWQWAWQARAALAEAANAHIAALEARIAAAEKQEPGAWMTEDGRVISAAQKQGMLKDGGAGASSVAPYDRPFYAAPLPSDGWRKDAERLDFVVDQRAWIQWTTRDGSITQCQVYDQDEDENYHVLSGDDRYFNTPREAIDAALAKQQQEPKE